MISRDSIEEDLQLEEIVSRSVREAVPSDWLGACDDGENGEELLFESGNRQVRLSVQDVEMVIESAIGGANITTTIEGRERFPVNVRYQRHFRTDVNALKRTLISTMSGAQIPIEQVADITLTTGPTVIRTEQAQLLGYVYVDVADRDIGGYVADAKQKVSELVTLPEGYTLEWSGQYEYMMRAEERLKLVIPLAFRRT